MKDGVGSIVARSSCPKVDLVSQRSSNDVGSDPKSLVRYVGKQ